MQEDLWERGLVRDEKYNNNCVAHDIRDYKIVIKKYFVLFRERVKLCTRLISYSGVISKYD